MAKYPEVRFKIDGKYLPVPGSYSCVEADPGGEHSSMNVGMRTGAYLFFPTRDPGFYDPKHAKPMSDYDRGIEKLINDFEVNPGNWIGIPRSTGKPYLYRNRLSDVIISVQPYA
jgi:hypothetical protein